MSNPFHDLADQYDALTDQLRALGDEWGVGTLSVGVQAEEETKADEPKDQPKDAKK